MYFRTLLCVVIFLHSAAMAQAGTNDYARMLVHLVSPLSKNACALRSDPPSCDGIETSGQLETDYDAYVILSNVGSSVGDLRFGIAYDGATGSGVDVSSWTGCATWLEFPVGEWPAAGSGNTLVWNSLEACTPTTVGFYNMFVAGYFELRALTPDEFRITVHPSDSKVTVGDCSGIQDYILPNGVTLPLGWAVFSAGGSAAGSNPCGYFTGSCHLSGPDTVMAGQTEIQYVMAPDEVTATGFWTLLGSAGEITSSNTSSATVHAIAPGLFNIVYQRTSGCVEGCGCNKYIQVTAPLPVHRTTWGQIKARAASSRP